MSTASIEEVQARLPELLRDLGSGDEILIVAGGKPVGRLLPAPMPNGMPIAGRGKGKLVIHAEDDEHLRDFTEYMP